MSFTEVQAVFMSSFPRQRICSGMHDSVEGSNSLPALDKIGLAQRGVALRSDALHSRHTLLEM